VRFLQKTKDGGPDSTVDAYWLFEIKPIASVGLLKFGPGSREEYHGHAFNAVSWLFGTLIEQFLEGKPRKRITSLLPILTFRSTVHRTVSVGTSYALTFRGPWVDTWPEHNPKTNEDTTLTHGRKIVS
jgi:hypothetical protein